MRIGIIGAGAIGGYLAAELSSGGAPVTLVGRRGSAPEAPVAIPIRGGRLTAGGDFVASDTPSSLASVDLCLVTVKSRDTAAVAEQLAQVLPRRAGVIPLQNGLQNAARLREKLRPDTEVLGGVVSFNVARGPDGERRQATEGLLWCGTSATSYPRLASLRRCFARAGERLELRRDIEAVMAGKLLLNLNNGICAATGLGVADSLADGDARWCFSRCIREALAVMRRAGIAPARVAPLPASWIAWALLLPDALVMPIARRMVGVLPSARSSTLQDLDRGRATEIDELNGGVVWLAERAGTHAPMNAVITEVVHAHERQALQGAAPDFSSPRELRARLAQAGRVSA